MTCPNTPRCEHPAMVHDIDTYEDPRPMCCAEGCTCGQPEAVWTNLPVIAINHAQLEGVRRTHPTDSSDHR